MIRLLIADDHMMVRKGLRDMLTADPEMEVVAEAGDGEEALVRYREHRPDVALLDLRMPKRDGISTITAIRSEFPDARLVALSNCQGDEDIFRAIQAGARAYLFKDIGPQQLVATVRAVHTGGLSLDPAVKARIAARARRPSLTPREMEVLEMMAKGIDNKLIAHALGISPETVREHVAHVLRKLDVANRTEAVAWAIETGVLHRD